MHKLVGSSFLSFFLFQHVFDYVIREHDVYVENPITGRKNHDRVSFIIFTYNESCTVKITKNHVKLNL